MEPFFNLPLMLVQYVKSVPNGIKILHNLLYVLNTNYLKNSTLQYYITPFITYVELNFKIQKYIISTKSILLNSWLL